jgi:hypothetical protein
MKLQTLLAHISGEPAIVNLIKLKLQQNYHSQPQRHRIGLQHPPQKYKHSVAIQIVPNLIIELWIIILKNCRIITACSW